MHVGWPAPARGVRGGEDVVNAELDVPVRGAPRDGRAGRGQGLAAGDWGPACAGRLRGARGRPRISPARPPRLLALRAAPAPPPAEVAVLKKVQQRLAAAGEGPVVALAPLVAVGPRHLCPDEGLSAAGSQGRPARRAPSGAPGAPGGCPAPGWARRWGAGEGYA